MQSGKVHMKSAELHKGAELHVLVLTHSTDWNEWPAGTNELKHELKRWETMRNDWLKPDIKFKWVYSFQLAFVVVSVHISNWCFFMVFDFNWF